MNNTSGTNWAALEAMSDEDINYSDILPLTDAFFEKATLRISAHHAHQQVQIDPVDRSTAAARPSVIVADRQSKTIPQGTLADLRGIAKRDGPAPTDEELKDEYADYLIQKYQ
jgi:hypothetical protein